MCMIPAPQNHVTWRTTFSRCLISIHWCKSTGFQPVCFSLNWADHSPEILPARRVGAKFLENDHVLSYWKPYQILPPVSRGLGHEVPLQGAAWGDACGNACARSSGRPAMSLAYRSSRVFCRPTTCTCSCRSLRIWRSRR